MQDMLDSPRPAGAGLTPKSQARRAIPLSSAALVLLALALGLVWFAQLDIRHLVPSDEGRYAEMAREMFVTGDWITPRYNGYKYFEKPPLQTWLNALTFAWFGIGDWQARLYTALTGFAGILALGYTGWRVFNPASGVLAAAVMASAPYWYLMGHYNTLDMGLSFWMGMSLCALLLAQRADAAPAARRGWMWACWASMALAVLTKGLVGLILPGAVLVLYTLIARDWQIWKRLYLVSGLIVFMAIVAPWFVLVQRDNPEFFHFFFIVQQFERYLTPAQNRPGPPWYFVPVLLVGFLPWLSVAVQSVRHGLRMPRQQNGFAPVTLMLTWAAFIFLFFSASHSKLVSYTLPVVPALALLLGAYLSTVTRAQWQRHLYGYALFLVAAAFGALFLGGLGDARTPNALYRAFQLYVWIAIGAALVLTLLALWLNRRGGLRSSRLITTTQTPAPATVGIIVFAWAWIGLASIAGNGHEVFGRQSSGVLLAPAIKSELARLPADTPFYSVGVLDHTLPFYVEHTTIMVASADELAFGVSVEPHKWVPSYDAFVQRWNSDAHALALMPPKTYLRFADQGLPMRVVARDNRRVVVEKVEKVR